MSRVIRVKKNRSLNRVARRTSFPVIIICLCNSRIIAVGEQEIGTRPVKWDLENKYSGFRRVVQNGHKVLTPCIYSRTTFF